MLIAWLPLLICLLGLLVYALASNPKASEVGRLAFFAGLLVTVWTAAHAVVRLP